MIRWLTRLIALSALLATGCGSSFLPPPPVRPVSMHMAPSIGGGAIQPVGGAAGTITATGRFSNRNRRRWLVDVGQWSNHFAMLLRPELEKRGVVTTAGPYLRVQVMSLSMRKMAFLGRRSCEISAQVWIGQSVTSVSQLVRARNARVCLSGLVQRLTADILKLPTVLQAIRYPQQQPYPQQPQPYPQQPQPYPQQPQPYPQQPQPYPQPQPQPYPQPQPQPAPVYQPAPQPVPPPPPQ